MGTPSIGKAALVLTTDASGARAGLDQFGKEAKQSIDQIANGTRAAGQKAAAEVEHGFEHTQTKLNKAFGKFAKHEGGFAGILGVGLLADLTPALAGPLAILTAIVLLGKQFGDAVEKWVFGIDEAKESLTVLKKQLDAAGQSLEFNTKQADEWLGAMTDRSARGEFLGSRVDDLKAQRQEIEKTIGVQQKWFESQRLVDRLASPFRPEGSLRVSTVQEVIGEEKKRIEEIDKQIRDLQLKRDRELNPASDPAFIGRINQATAALKEQVDTWGLVGSAAQRAKFASEGATDAMLKRFDEAAARLDRLNELGKTPPPWLSQALIIAGEAARIASPQDSPPWLSGAISAAQSVTHAGGQMFKEFADIQQELKDAIDFPGSSSIEKRVRDMERRGLPKEQSDQLRALMPEKLPPWLGGALGAATAVIDQVSKLHKPALDNAALLRGSAAEVSARNRYENGARSAADKMVGEQQKGNATLREIEKGISAIADRPTVELLPF